MTLDVLIRGGGVAAACCARLLSRAGFRIGCESAARPRLPAILLGEQAQHLIGDVFEDPGLFQGLPRVRTRIVAWGDDSTPGALPHAAVAISEEELLGRLATPLPTAPAGAEAKWTIVTSQPAAVRQFGAREAAALRVELREEAEAEACWIESVSGGWLFLITTAPRTGWMLAVGEPANAPLAASRMIAGKIARTGDCAGRFSAAPRIAAPPCGPGWLACGSAAMAFDPLCGDGTAHAVREGILAAAVIEAEARGEDRDALLCHYRARMTAAFERHLLLCQTYYRSGGVGSWWDEQARALADGLAWCRAELEQQHGYRYRLEGFELTRRQS